MALDTAEKLRYVSNISSRGSLGKPSASGLDQRAMANETFTYLVESDFPDVPIEDIETLYPIQPTALGNTIVYRKGNGQFVQVKKSASLWRAEVVTLRHRGQETVMEELYTFLVLNKGLIVTMTTCGFQPFIRTEETNDVYIISFSAPERINAQIWELSVTYRGTLVT